MQECKKEQRALKGEQVLKELDNYLKWMEDMLEADELLDGQKYAEAQQAYKNAEKRACCADQIGLDYIQDRLELTANYLSVYDLIRMGDALALSLRYEEAKEKYLEAKRLARKIYFDDGRAAAIDALERLSASQKGQEAKEYLAQAEEAAAANDVIRASRYYLLAKDAYVSLKDDEKVSEIAQKLEALS